MACFDLSCFDCLLWHVRDPWKSIDLLVYAALKTVHPCCIALCMLSPVALHFV
jgi:hypothetical protein